MFLFATNASTRLINWLFPPVCVHCGREGTWLCPEAVKQFSPVIRRHHLPDCDLALTMYSYDQPAVGAFIQALKYKYWTGLKPALPPLVAAIIPALPTHREIVIIPVPLHTRRQRERGFNQSHMLAESLGAMAHYPIVSLLKRVRYTPPQAQLTAKRRLSNVRGAFALRSRVAHIPKCVILVDDVITTGSTIAECASVLRQAEVKTIIAVALAKG